VVYHIAAAVDGFGPWSTFKTSTVDGAALLHHDSTQPALLRVQLHGVAEQSCGLDDVAHGCQGRVSNRTAAHHAPSSLGSTQYVAPCIRRMFPARTLPMRAGTRNVLKAAAKAKVPRLVHMSSEAVLVHGDEPIVDADETTPLPNDPGFYAPYSKSKAMAERLVVVSASCLPASCLLHSVSVRQ